MFIIDLSVSLKKKLQEQPVLNVLICICYNSVLNQIVSTRSIIEV